MDTYTKQVDCPEIQGLWGPKIGDRIYSSISKEIEVLETNIFNSPLKARVIKISLYLPRQEDWQNILFREHYAPALPKSAKVIQAALIHMHREFVDYMESWKIDQPCEAWARMFMNRAHKKQWTDEGWK